MKIMLLGKHGMLGHQLLKTLLKNHEVFGVGRELFDATDKRGDFAWLSERLTTYKPEVLINCIGVVKQRKHEPDNMIEVNALLPHRLYRMAREVGARLIHFSTDCVFSGSLRNYSEDSVPDPVDLYGRTKHLGEVVADGALTIRTSIIGHELYGRQQGLLEWFLSHGDETVKGYSSAAFSGLTTNELSKIVEMVVSKYPHLQGVWHVAGPRITKLALLTLIKQAYCSPTQIVPESSPVLDRSLNAHRFNCRTKYWPPEWRQMIHEMKEAQCTR